MLHFWLNKARHISLIQISNYKFINIFVMTNYFVSNNLLHRFNSEVIN